MVQSGSWQWERLGAPSGGAVTGLAASPAFSRDAVVFAATMAGLFRSRDGGRTWRRLGEGFKGLSLMSVVVSPAFEQDGIVLVASLEGGVFRVSNDGDTWNAGNFQGRHVDVSALALSPNFANDGVAFAATLADGVFISRNRGATWESSTFGLLDLEVTGLAISPNFEHDGTIFAATASGLFRSPNAGRAWKEATFPADTAPLLSLAISPDFGEDRTLFVGTDGGGLFRSLDRGASWQQVAPALSDACVNAIAASPAFSDDRTVLMVTEAAVYVSRDDGDTWTLCTQADGALCLALAPTFAAGGPALVGLTQQGILRATADLTDWQPANEGLAGHRLTGLAVSVGGALSVAAFGSGDGVLWSPDGGAAWSEAGDGLPSLNVAGVAIGPRPDGRTSLYAALPEGVWKRDLGKDWQRIGDIGAQFIRSSPGFIRDRTLVVGATDGNIWIVEEVSGRWQRASVPWPERDILALALSPEFERDQTIFAAVRDPHGSLVEVWQGARGGGWQPVVAYDSAVPRAALAVPATLPWDGTWYAAIGEQVYGPLSLHPDSRGAQRQPTGMVLASSRPAVLDLALLGDAPPFSVLAATERGLFVMTGGRREWQAFDAGEAPGAVVAVASIPGGSAALEVGGTLWRMHHADS